MLALDVTTTLAPFGWAAVGFLLGGFGVLLAANRRSRVEAPDRPEADWVDEPRRAA